MSDILDWVISENGSLSARPLNQIDYGRDRGVQKHLTKCIKTYRHAVDSQRYRYCHAKTLFQLIMARPWLRDSVTDDLWFTVLQDIGIRKHV